VIFRHKDGSDAILYSLLKRCQRCLC